MRQAIPFGEWLPDRPPTGNPGSTEAKNCVPNRDGYESANALVVTSDALGAYCRGAAAYSDADGNAEIYAGDATKLYRVASDVWADKSGAAYTTGTNDYWRFVAWGQRVIATNYADNIQTKAFGAGTNFADLSGSPPKARHIATVRSFVVLGDVNDGTRRANRVQWSGQNLETSWGSNPATQADYQDLLGDGGRVMCILGGDVGVVLQERSLWEMHYAGPPLAFSFSETLVGIGTPAERSPVRFGSSVFFWSNEGFIRYDIGGGPTRIGNGKVDRWFSNRVNTGQFHRVIGALDLNNAKIVWAYPTAGQSDPNEMIIYDFVADRWAWCELTTEYVLSGRGSGVTLEGLDAIMASIDAGTISLDDESLKGNTIALYGFSTAHKMGAFNGSPLTSDISTTEFSLPDESVMFCNNARPIMQAEGSTVTMTVDSRNKMTASPTTGSVSTENDLGSCDLRESGRYLRFNVSIAGGFTHAMGVSAEIIPQGVR